MTMMNKQTEALKMAIVALEQADQMSLSEYSRQGDYDEAIKACKEALEQENARLVSYAPDGSTCTLNIDGEEVYFNREQPAQDDIEKRLDYAHARGFKEGAENAYKKTEQSAQEPVEIQTEPRFYLQNKDAGYLGNAPIWWAKGGKGYTAYIKGAERFTMEKAKDLVNSNPSKFAMYSCAEIESRLHFVFDMQDFKCIGTNEPCGWDFGYATHPAPQPAQEPVEYLCGGARYKTVVVDGQVIIQGLPDELNGKWVALVEATDDKHLKPHPAPSWQGLSVYDILSIDGLDCVDENDLISFARAVEQKSKEKNHG